MKPACEYKTPDPAALAQLLRQTRSVLACHVELGIINYPATPELRHFAALRITPPVLQSRKPDKLPPTAQSLPTAEKKPQAPISSRAEIAEQLAQCRRCADAASQMPGFGSAAPRLVVVGDYFIGAERGQNVLWGREEDELFWKMMTAIGLSRETVYVTNVFKCAQKELPQPGSKAEQSCRPWLEAELQAIRPQLICAMGETAARVLLGGGNIPLARLRLQKKFHPCCCPHDSTAQVLPTYHPRLLLQHTEMKKAAWEDLQALQWRLQAGN